MRVDNLKRLYRIEPSMPGYTFLDREFYDAAGILHFTLKEQDVRYALVGGAGVQARIASALTADGTKPLKDVKGLPLLLRPTSDLDIATLNADQVKMLRAGQSINDRLKFGFDARERHLKFGVRGNKGPLFVKYELGPEDFKGLPSSYNSIVESAEPVTLRYHKTPIEINVARPEHLVASKLTRGDHKDTIDIANLLKVLHSTEKKFDAQEVRAILKDNDKGECFRNLEKICLDLGLVTPA